MVRSMRELIFDYCFDFMKQDLPIIIVEFGQQRQRLQLNKFYYNLNELFELFSRTFQTKFNSQKYDILLFNNRLDSMTNLDFTQLDNYPRFKIQLNNKQISSYSSANEMVNKLSMKKRNNHNHSFRFH